MRIVLDRNGEDGKITLPKDMTHDKAISVLQAEKDLETYDEREVTVVETIQRFPYEAAFALRKAIEILHGASIGEDIRLPNGGMIEAKLIGVPIGVNETAQVPWGPFRLPDIEGLMETGMGEEDGTMVMTLRGRVKRKYQKKIQELANKTKEIVQQESIYRGKAFKVRFRNEKGELDVPPPKFMDLSGEHRVIFSEEVRLEIGLNVLTPIRKLEQARKMRIPGKRGILLCGTYGSGKTLTAYMVAKEATAVGRTFIYVEDSSELPDALPFAASLAPSVVFAEDIDRVTTGLRSRNLDRLLNKVDGVDTKNADVITVLTTNNLELIHPAFLREGRTDTIITIDKPDIQATEELLRHFGGDLIAKGESLRNVAAKLVERTPAFIREVVERSKLQLLYQAPDGAETPQLTAKDLELGYFRHAKEREAVEQAMREGDMIRVMMDQLASQGVERVVVRKDGKQQQNF